MESMCIQQINLYLATCTLFYSVAGKYSETPIKRGIKRLEKNIKQNNIVLFYTMYFYTGPSFSKAG